MLKAWESVPHNRIFASSSRLAQQLRPGTVEAAFSRRPVEIQCGPGLFPGEMRLVAVVSGGGVQVSNNAIRENGSFSQGLNRGWRG